jgi:hypothetical protein
MNLNGILIKGAPFLDTYSLIPLWSYRIQNTRYSFIALITILNKLRSVGSFVVFAEAVNLWFQELTLNAIMNVFKPSVCEGVISTRQSRIVGTEAAVRFCLNSWQQRSDVRGKYSTALSLSLSLC